MTTATITDTKVVATVSEDTIVATIQSDVVQATVARGLVAASESVAGALEIATSAEALALTATDRAIVPSVFYSAYSGAHGGHIDVTKSHNITTGTSTNQASALDAAVDSITSNGDIAYIPGGAVIRVDEGLVPAANAVIQGGPGATLQSLATGVGTYMFAPAGIDGVSIRGVKFLGVLGASAALSTDTAIFNQTAAADNWVIEYCEFDSFWARSVRSNGVDMERMRFTHNYVHDIYNLGLDLSHLVEGIIAFNHFDTCGNASGDWAMYASNPANGILIEGNHIQNCYAGIKVIASTNKVRIFGNEVLTPTGGDCIVIGDGTGYTVAHNVCYPATSRPAIVLETTTADAIIEGNRIDLGGNAALGIQVESATDTDIKNNKIYNGDGAVAAIGIDVLDGTDIEIANNRISGCGVALQYQTANTFTRVDMIANRVHGAGSGKTGLLATSNITGLVDCAIRGNTFTNCDINIDFGSESLTDCIITDNHSPDGVAGSRFIRASGMVRGVVANNIANQALVNFALGTLGTAVVFGNKSTSAGAFVTFTNNDTTPAVDLGDSFICSNTGSTTITNFDSGADGRTVTIHFTTANTTLTDGTNIMLSGSTNYTPAAGTIMQFQLRSSVWYELSRVNT